MGAANEGLEAALVSKRPAFPSGWDHHYFLYALPDGLVQLPAYLFLYGRAILFEAPFFSHQYTVRHYDHTQ